MTDFTPKTITKRFLQQIQAAPSAVFPLLCPVREYEWIEPWRCEMLHSTSGVAEKNCVFRTRMPGESSDDVWVISHYEPNVRIEFVRTNALRTMCLSNTLTDNRDGTSRNVVEVLLVGLTEEGNLSLDGTAENLAFELRVGEAMLNHYLATGKRLPAQKAIEAASAKSN